MENNSARRNQEEVQKNHGFTKPDFAGRVFGQVFGSDGYVETGKRYPAKRKDGTIFWIPIVESRFFSHWVWNGAEWLTAEEFKTQFEDRPPVPAEIKKRFPSKNDFDGLGMPKRFR